MPSSDFLAQSIRTPALRVLANGAPIANVIDTLVLSNSHYAADRFRVTAAIVAPDAASWSQTTDALVDIQVTLDRRAWASLLRGHVDTVEIDPIIGLLTLVGRDLAAPLIDSRTQETFTNQTSSEIALALAARHGLTADIQQTKTPVGRYWQLEHDSLTLNQYCNATTEWDLLVTLARLEAFDVWIDGSTLHFRPVTTVQTSTVLRPVATLSGPPNVTGLRLERTLTLARDLVVTVRSWNNRQSNAFTQTARASRGTAGITSIGRAPPLNYIYVVPNLSPDEALRLAQSRLAELTQHERVILADMPGELTLTPRSQIRLEGTNTSFDQSYMIDEIERHFSPESGFTQYLRARNASQAV